MDSALNLFPNFNASFFWTEAILAALGGVAMLVVYLAGRRALQQFRIRRYDELAFKLHNQWREIIRGSVPAETWRKDPMQCEIVQSIVVQDIGAATDKDRIGLQEFLRATGLIDLCIEKVDRGHGWARRRAMMALGAMRVPEAISPLSDALDDWQLEARVASELATAEMADEMIVLAEDPRPEVRAAAAKALGAAPLPLAIPALGDLARDEVWFVRLRATIALNEIRHPRTIPILLEAVRDPNRLVRMRAASTLARFEQDRVEILQSIVDSSDRYALHAMISALELGGGFEQTLKELSDPLLHDETAERLLTALREGAAGLWTTRPADPAIESVFP